MRTKDRGAKLLRNIHTQVGERHHNQPKGNTKLTDVVVSDTSPASRECGRSEAGIYFALGVHDRRGAQLDFATQGISPE